MCNFFESKHKTNYLKIDRKISQKTQLTVLETKIPKDTKNW